MTPRMLPVTPDFEHPTEEAVWELLAEQLPDEAVVVANR